MSYKFSVGSISPLAQSLYCVLLAQILRYLAFRDWFLGALMLVFGAIRFVIDIERSCYQLLLLSFLKLSRLLRI